MDKPIRKAVLPVAGLGTRFLPATKAIPKEMLTVVDRPILQHVVDEAREAGIEHFIFVTGRNKGVIEDHFDNAYELEDTLKRRGKKAEYDALMADLPTAGAASFTRQQAPLGLGHAVWCAREIVGSEPFAVLLPDMVTRPGTHGGRCLAQCVAAYEKHGGNIIAVEEVPPTNMELSESAPTMARPSRSPKWSKSRSRGRRPRISSFRGATFFSRGFFKSWSASKKALAAKFN
jgi:UTP--glucose-1-phosphate uridylyltransferase